VLASLSPRSQVQLNKEPFDMSIRLKQLVIGVCLAVFGFAGSAAAQGGVGVGVKGGIVFPQFNSDALKIDSDTSWQLGLFLGGNLTGVVGSQIEFNYLQKKGVPTNQYLGSTLKVEYLQIPVLFRIHTPSTTANSFQVYGLFGPSFDVKLRESLEGSTVSVITDGFENFDFGMLFGAGVEAGRVIFEGRYERGFRTINKNFASADELKSHSFAALVGIRFN
jgi:hypothetical protein